MLRRIMPRFRGYKGCPARLLIGLLTLSLLVFNTGLALKPAADNLITAAGPDQAQPPNQAVVRLAAGTDPGQVAAAVGGQIIRRGPLDYVTLALPAGEQEETALAQLRRLPGVLSAAENHRRRLQSVAVTDDHYQEQWGLTKAGVPEAWNLGAAGQGITIAVVDTGVNINHPDLKNNIVAGYNAINQTGGLSAANDNNGHGTHVAGIAAAALNGSGIVGVAYQAKIMPVKAMDRDGEGYDDVIADGIVWAADHGARIINLSLGSGDRSQVLADAVSYAAGRGAIIVAASGNYDPAAQTDPGVTYPAADPQVLAVTATDSNDQVADFSATGPQVALAAPGVDIVSDWLSARYAAMDGTSMAAPFVSGEAALIWSLHPDWKRGQVIEAMEAGVRDLGPAGRDPQYGYGRVDVGLAVQLTNPPPVMAAPATVGRLGAKVTAQAAGTQAGLTVPAGALAGPAPVDVQPAALPQPLPDGVTALSVPVDVRWAGAAVQKILSLQIDDSRITADAAVLYRWDGRRWLAVGGEGAAGRIRLGIFLPGVYAAGTPLPGNAAGPGRIYGRQATDTAIEISKQAYPLGADAVLLARDDNFPDALAGAPLAYKLQAPILLTPPGGLTAAVRAEIERLKPAAVYLLGGVKALAPSIQTELAAQYTVKRLAGPTAAGTAAAIAAELGTAGQAVVVNGDVFPDALVIGAQAARRGEPVLLTGAQSLPPETAQALAKFSITGTLVVGGEKVVGPGVFSALPLPARLAGLTQYDTTAAVLQAFPPLGRTVYLATGENYPDALTGAPLAAQTGTDIILVPPAAEVPAGIAAAVSAWRGKVPVVLGGPAALSPAVAESFRSLLP